MNENEQMNNLTRKVIKKASIESPSFDFTTQIMARIIDLEQSKATTYKPLISKTTWALIFGSFIVLVIYVFFGMDLETKPSLFAEIDFRTLINNSILTRLFSISFSKTLLYALLFLSIMVLIQVPVLKCYLNKRFEV